MERRMKFVSVVLLAMLCSAVTIAGNLTFLPNFDHNWDTVGNWLIGDGTGGGFYGMVPQPEDTVFLYGCDPGQGEDPVIINDATVQQIWIAGEQVGGLREGAGMDVFGDLVTTGNFIPGAWNDVPSYNVVNINPGASITVGATMFTTNPNSDAEYLFSQAAGSSFVIADISFWGALLNFQTSGYLEFQNGNVSNGNSGNLLINLMGDAELVIGSDSLANVIADGSLQANGALITDVSQLGVTDLGDGFVSCIIPEPATLALLGLGVLALRRRK